VRHFRSRGRIGLDIPYFFPIIKPSLAKCRPMTSKYLDVSCFIVLCGQGACTDKSGSTYLYIFN